jgi:hypothetical protein
MKDSFFSSNTEKKKSLLNPYPQEDLFSFQVRLEENVDLRVSSVICNESLVIFLFTLPCYLATPYFQASFSNWAK